MERSTRINTKDLINIGIYLAIYFVIIFVVGMLNTIPILYPILFLIWPIVGGIPFMLFLTKAQKPGMVFIMAILIGLICFVFGYSWMAIAACSISGLLAEFFLKAGDYKKFKYIALSYSVFSFWIITFALPIWVIGDTYIAGIRQSVGDQYADGLLTYMPGWMAFAGLALLFVGGILGALLGSKMLKKHFIKAGIV